MPALRPLLLQPLMEATCCPSYTIRLHVPSFRPSRDHSKTLRKLHGWLARGGCPPPGEAAGEKRGGGPPCEAGGAAPRPAVGSAPPPPPPPAPSSRVGSGPEGGEGGRAGILGAALARAVSACVAAGQLPRATYPVPRVTVPTARQLPHLPGGTCLVTALPLAVYALSRRAAPGPHPGSPDVVAGMLLARLAEDGPSWVGALVRAEAANGYLNFVSTSSEEATGDLTGDLELAGGIASAAPSSAAASPAAARASPPVPPSPPPPSTLEVRTAPSEFRQEDFELYRRYQVAVHDDKPGSVTPTSYRRFLVDSPLLAPPGSPYGSFHQQYWLGGRLVMVGVVDVLPRCLSSVYLFWDPDFASLSLGKVSALQEIAWAQRASLKYPSLQYYYMGYYIHSCPKMRYKGAYEPSELLCPVRGTWVPLADCVARLEKDKARPGAGPGPRDGRKGESDRLLRAPRHLTSASPPPRLLAPLFSTACWMSTLPKGGGGWRQGSRVRPGPLLQGRPSPTNGSSLPSSNA